MVKWTSVCQTVDLLLTISPPARTKSESKFVKNPIPFLVILFTLSSPAQGFGAKTIDLTPSETDTVSGDGSISGSAPVRVVVSASRREMPAEESTRFITVITRDQIERSGKTYIFDLLRSTPGVHIAQSGPAGRGVTVNLRGTNANHTLVLIDGVQVNGPTTGQSAIEHITTQSVERVEVLRGAHSVLYGADAIGGVINIVMRQEDRHGLHGDANFEYGTFQTFREGGELSAAYDRIQSLGSFGRIDSKGPGDNDGYQNTTVRNRSKVHFSENSNLETFFYYFNAQSGIDDGAFRQDPNRTLKSREQVVNSRYNIALRDWWQQYFQYSFFHDLQVDFDPRNSGGADPEAVPFRLDTDRHTLEYQSTLFVRDWDVIVLGYEFEHIASNIKRSVGFDELMRTHAVFFQNEATFWDSLKLVGGVRLDHNNFYGVEVNPQFSGSWWLEKTQTRVKGNMGRAFKAPTFNELSFPNFGNQNVRPETSWSWDAGIEQYYWDKRGRLSAAYFRNSVKDLIQFVSGSTGVFTAENVARARLQGVEVEHEIQLHEHISLSTAYTYTSTEDRETGKRLTRRPWHQGKIGLTADYRKFKFYADWSLVGGQDDTQGSVRVRNKGYTRLDFTLTYSLTEYLELYGRVENATYDHFNEVLGFDQPPPRFFGGVRLKG